MPLDSICNRLGTGKLAESWSEAGEEGEVKVSAGYQPKPSLLHTKSLSSSGLMNLSQE